MLSLDVETWAKQQFDTCQLGDKRRTKRAVKFAAQMAAQPDATTPEQIATAVDAALPRVPLHIVGHSFGAGAATELVMRYPDRARALVLVDAALGLTASPSDPPAIVQPKWIREVLVSLTITNPLATKFLLQSLIAKKERALPEYVEILQRPTHRAGSTPDIADWLYYFIGSDRGAQSADRDAASSAAFAATSRSAGVACVATCSIIPWIVFGAGMVA